MSAKFREGDRVWWWLTSTTTRRGVVADLDGMIGVRVDDGAGIVYVDAQLLHNEADVTGAAS